MRLTPLEWLRGLLTLAFLPTPWRMPMYGLLGVVAGLGLLVLRISEFPSYLSDSPRTCINCHIMAPEYATWQRSSHAAVATCNDCHVPHDSVARKYLFKAKDGMRHAAIFTLRGEPQVIRAHPASQQVIQENCRRCHTRFIAGAPALHDGKRACVDCHATPHDKVHSLASTPAVPSPQLPPVAGRQPRTP